MRLAPSQLTHHLKKHLSHFYFISGDDPCLVEEATVAIRKKASEQGFTLREIIHIDNNFDWQHFLTTSYNLSLFAEKKLVEVHLNLTKFSDVAQKSLLKLLHHPPIEKIIVLRSGKLAREFLNAKWFKEIETQGIFIPVWPLQNKQLDQWVIQQLASANLTARTDAVKLLIDYCEGNLFALKQEIEKLALYFDDAKSITKEELIELITQHARFNIFELANTLLVGDSVKVLKIISQLMAEGTEPMLILWSLTRELRKLAIVSHHLEQGKSADKILKDQGIWERQKQIMLTAAARYPAHKWQQLLRHAAEVDRTIKSQTGIKIQIELEQLALHIAGLEV